MVLTLEVVDPPTDFVDELRKSFDEEGGTIGRRAGNTWVLSDNRVSGEHATIRFQYGAYSIIDTSTNGTFVGDGLTRLTLGQSHRLRSADVVCIGPYRIRASVTQTADGEDATIIASPSGMPPLDLLRREASTPSSVTDSGNRRFHEAERSWQLPSESTVLKTLVITDLVASTRMTEKLGDTRASEIFGRQDRLARDLLAQHNGTEVDKTDGFLLFFNRPIEAVDFAMAYHRALDELSREIGVEIATRVAIHLGEVVLRKNTNRDIARGANAVEVEGLAKPFTARLMGLACGKQTLLSRSAFDVAKRSVVGGKSEYGDLCWLTHGGYKLKGVEEPVEVFEVGLEGFGPLTAPPDSEKAKRSLGATPHYSGNSDESSVIK
ncbi:MAG: FHA domain-containing protein [Acidobacteriota bacterium]|nr:FHA domain-containing protein [Acidobacteriota bacterium]